MTIRIVRKRPATLTHRFAGLAAASNVTVTVRNDAGGIVTGPTVVQTNADLDAELELTADLLPNLDLLTVDWDAGGGHVETDLVEVAGARFATVDEVRALKDLGDTNRFPDALIVEAISRVEELIEDDNEVAWVPRYHGQVLDGSGTAILRVEKSQLRTVRSASIAGAALDVGALHPYPTGKIVRASGVWTAGLRNVDVAYEHGFDGPPRDLKDAAVDAIRSGLLEKKSSAIPERAQTMSSEIGTFSLALAGPNRPTGYPDIDARILAHRGGGLVAIA